MKPYSYAHIYTAYQITDGSVTIGTIDGMSITCRLPEKRPGSADKTSPQQVQ
jgi:hypothetical protein